MTRTDRTGAVERTAAIVVEPERLTTFTRSVFERVGFSCADADQLADYFLWAELHDLAFVGARRIPEFVERVRAGGARIGTSDELDVVHERSGMAVVDAGDTLAQLTGVRAMRLAMGKARSNGVGVVALRNTTTAGALGYYADIAADDGMIGLVISNTPPVMAAAGGSVGVIGAQPFAVAAPSGRHPTLRLDMTNSVMSMVRIWDSHVRGEPLPEGVALADGEPTAEPMAAISGTLLPMGHRGYALALMWEVLTGVLGGAERYADRVGGPGDVAHPMAVTILLLAIDPTVSMGYEAFLERVDHLIDRVHSSPTVAGVDRVVVPGERSNEAAAIRGEAGIPMPRETVASLVALGSELGLPW